MSAVSSSPVGAAAAAKQGSVGAASGDVARKPKVPVVRLPFTYAVGATLLCPEGNGVRVVVDGERDSIVVRPSARLRDLGMGQQVLLIYRVGFEGEARDFRGQRIEAGMRNRCVDVVAADGLFDKDPTEGAATASKG